VGTSTKSVGRNLTCPEEEDEKVIWRTWWLGYICSEDGAMDRDADPGPSSSVHLGTDVVVPSGEMAAA